MPATESLRQRINELTAAPAAKKTRRRKKSVEPARASEKDWTDAEKRALAQAQAAGLGLYDIVVKIDPHCTMPIAARQLIQNAISGIGQVIVVRPDAKSPAASKQVQFVFASTQSKEQIAAKCHIPTIAGDIAVTLIEAPAAKAPKGAQPDVCARARGLRFGAACGASSFSIASPARSCRRTSPSARTRPLASSGGKHSAR